MSGTFTLAWKDFKQLVTSPMFFLIAGLCACLWSPLYMNSLFQFAQQSMMSGMGGMGAGNISIHTTTFRVHLSQVNIILVFAIPAITMRLISEEKKMRTYDLLLTAPIKAFDIALGKFFAAYMAALVLLCIGMLYPLATGFIADFHYGPLLSSYLGLALLTAIYVAAGLFASSMTESVVLAVVMGLIFNLTLWFLGTGVEMTDHPIASAILEHISLGQQFMPFVLGNLKLSAVIFMLSVVALFVFLAERVVESSRWR